MVTFPPIYVINLKRVPERRLYMQRQLDALGLSYQFIDAIDKFDLKSSQYCSRISRMFGIDKAVFENKYAQIMCRTKMQEGKNWENAGLGQLAITLSHIKIYDLMIKNNTDWACILEDDATLLPTFLKVLKITPKLDWDILLLANYSSHLFFEVIKDPIKHFRILGKDLVFLKRQLKKTSSSQEGKDYRIKRLLEEHGFNSHMFPNITEEYDRKCAGILKKIIPANRRVSLIKREQYVEYRTLYKHLRPYVITRLGALPVHTSLDLITKHHCIAKPRHVTHSATAYLVKRHAAMKWRHKAFAENDRAIDDIPWQLYRGAKVKLRIITPPCAVPAHSSWKYSTRLK